MSLQEKKQMVKEKTARWGAHNPWALWYIGAVVTVSLVLQVVWR